MPQESYTFSSGRTITLINDHILIDPDPESPEIGDTGLIRPEGAYEHVYNLGTVKAVGLEKEKLLADTTKTKPLKDPRPIPDIHVGERCCYIRFHVEAGSNKMLREIGDGMILLRSRDLIFMLEPGDTVELGH